MNRHEHGLLTGLALLGTLLAAYQCWYVSLPTEIAARLDFCRWTILDCYESLNRHGESMLWTFAALLGLFLFMLGLSTFAWVARPSRREAWLALARLASFPASGLAVYVLLNDYLVAKITSPSALLVALVALALSVATVWRGLAGAKLRPGLRGALLLAAATALFSFFAHGAAAARREIARVEQEQADAPPRVRWAEFEPDIPRADAATLGDPMARHEILLFVDPRQEASRRLMRDALHLNTKEVLIYFFAPGDDGARLILAQRAGELARYLKDPASFTPADLDAVRPIVERQLAAAKIAAWPTAISKRGRKSGDEIDLRTLAATLRAR